MREETRYLRAPGRKTLEGQITCSAGYTGWIPHLGHSTVNCVVDHTYITSDDEETRDLDYLHCFQN